MLPAKKFSSHKNTISINHTHYGKKFESKITFSQVKVLSNGCLMNRKHKTFSPMVGANLIFIQNMKNSVIKLCFETFLGVFKDEKSFYVRNLKKER